MIKKAIVLFAAVLGLLITDSRAAQTGWGEIKDKHFVIFYESGSDKNVADNLLRRAEEYYRKIGDDIGYSRTNKMWTWDDRVQIYLFATQASYLANTGQPAWTTGYADRDSRLFKSKTIITFTQETDFVDGLLPHEISHLILHDFVANDSLIPVWFDEGVAQLQEKNKKTMARDIMFKLTRRNQQVPIEKFINWDVRNEMDPIRAQIFYVQSLSIVDFLIIKYGRDAFGRLCRQLRDNRDFKSAFLSVYSGIFKDYGDLEKKWLGSFNQ